MRREPETIEISHIVVIYKSFFLLMNSIIYAVYCFAASNYTVWNIFFTLN